MSLNKPFDIDAYNPASSADAVSQIPFGNLIGSILTASIDAQEHASDVAWEYTQRVLAHNTPLVFSFMENGVMKGLEVPLITVVPLPYMRLEKIDIDFDANVEMSHEDNDRFVANINNKSTQVSTVSTAKSTANLHININAATTDMPAGLSSLLQYIQNSVVVEDIDPNAPIDSSERPNYKKLFRLDYKSIVDKELEAEIDDEKILEHLKKNDKYARLNSLLQKGVLGVAREYINRYHYNQTHPSSQAAIEKVVCNILRNEIQSMIDYSDVHQLGSVTLSSLNQWATLLKKHRVASDAAKGLSYAQLKVPGVLQLQTIYCLASETEKLVCRLRSYVIRDLGQSYSVKPNINTLALQCTEDWLRLFLQQYYSSNGITPPSIPAPKNTSKPASAKSSKPKEKLTPEEEEKRKNDIGNVVLSVKRNKEANNK